MEIAISGSSGLVGRHLVPALRGAGHVVRPLVRRAPADDSEVQWDPVAGVLDPGDLAGVDAVVHLAGEGIAEKRWTPEQKRRILESRTQGTGLLARTIAGLDPKPRVFLSGSAVGFYGDGGDDVLTEESPRATGFLADVVGAWEAAAQPAVDAGIRTVFLRSGVILTPDGGAMGKVLPLFKLGIGGPIGKGQEWWPWISIDDEVGAIVHLLDADVTGPVNLVAPNPVRAGEYAKAIGRALHRPAILPVPRLGPELLLGRELADALLGQSQRIAPTQLEASGYAFRYPDIDTALQHLLA
jgi:uncharacterized protein (TIGR01777 family)